ncbi:non-ribosomal peptide synthetase [Catenulispora rubra]|uniref:non-ribosomal peptide synthetase n=1 Tax=Catenulispora rubra TaxID=280293 RepID=UPI0018926BF1|nr:non-ribosomal peptide synthetase [Catenulispora rubra]
MIQDLLAELREHGIRLRLNEDKLDVIAPPGSLSPELADRLRQARGELIDLLMRTTVSERTTRVSPDPANRHEPFPLTDLQHAYWVGRSSAIDLGGVACHYYFELERAGLDPARLAESLNKVIARHDMLRMVVEPDGRQRILAEAPVYELDVADLRELPPAEQEARLAHTRAEMDHKVRPTDRWPLFEVRASLLPAGTIRLHVGVDVIAVDGSSLYLLFREWRRFYEDPQWDPEPLGVSYRDYVLNEVAARDGEEYRRDEKYWLDQLDRLPPAPTPPLAGPTSGLTGARFTRRTGRVPAERWSRFKAVAQSRGLTPSAALTAAFSEVLRRWSQQPEFTMNLTLFNRPQVHEEINGVIGDFSSVTLLAVRSQEQDTFADRADRIQRQLMRDLSHQSFSGVRLLRERNRRLGGGPGAAMPVVFSSALFLASGQDDPSDAVLFFGERVYGVSQTPQVWLDHQVAEEQGELVFSWDAIEELFPAEELDDMFAAYQRVLTRLLDEPEAWEQQECLAELPAWQRAERDAANATGEGTDQALAATLGGLVEEAAAKRPDEVAVIAAEGTLTYRELLSGSRRLARRLRRLGAAPNTLVGVLLGKGADQVSAVLGVSLSGAGYLPVDPQWPQARRHELLARGGARIVVTSPELRRELVWPQGVELVTLSDPEVAACAEDPLDPVAAGTDLAYVIFTSGSTGAPKGVAVDHAAAVNTIVDVNRRFGVGPADRVLALSALTFDLSVYDVFGLLAAGGAVVVPPAGATQDPGRWRELVAEHSVTVWNSVPALMQLWTQAPDTAGRQPASIRLVLLSGDWIPVRLPEAIRRGCPDARLVGLGGATEGSIWSIFHPIPDPVPAGWTSIPYGRPLANQTMHVYDTAFQPCPVWTAGEIFIGGAGVARGYWNDPELTAERFVTHPDTGQRLYRTGDLGRYLPGGDIEFLGRQDSQVKINGYRIELGEVTAALSALPGVGQAVVGVGVNPGTGHRALMAHVVPAAAADAGDAGDAGEHAGPIAEWEPVLAAGEAELRTGVGELTSLLAEYQETSQLVEDLCPAIMARALSELGAFHDSAVAVSSKDFVDSYDVKPSYTGLLDRWLATLAEAGLLEAADEGGYRCRQVFDHAVLDAELRGRLDGLRVDPSHAALLEYLITCADNAAGLLTGKVNPLGLLLPDGDDRVTEALYATNPMARLQNRVTAAVVRAHAEALGDRPIRVLEVGAGTGATSRSVLAALPAGRTRYSFTDVSTYFLTKAKNRFRQHPSVDYGRFDIDRDPAGQGFAAGSVDVIVAANVMHDAADVGRALGSLGTLLAPDGLLVMIEGTANTRTQMISVGFIEGLAQEHESGRTPLLSVPQWREHILAAGYSDVRSIPEGASTVSGQPQHVLVARSAGAARRVPSGDALRKGLEQVLPDYMVPRHYLFLDRIPLTPNGKVDQAALPSPWQESGSQEATAPRDALEERLYEIWRDALEQDDFGVEDDFFVLGGDSLHAVNILGRLRDELGMEGDADEGLEFLFDNPTIAELAVALREQGVDGP